MGRRHSRAARDRRWLFMAACVSALGAAGLGGRSAAQDAPADDAAQGAGAAAFRPPVLITPSLGLRETFTDDAALTGVDKRSDFITRGMFGLAADIDHGRLTSAVTASAAYDRYAKLPELSGWSYAASASGEYVLLPQQLAIEAQGTLTTEHLSTFRGSATDRSGTPDRTQLAIYYLGPKLTTKLDDALDVTAAARVGQVLYSAADKSPVARLPSDDSFVQAVLRLDTGDRQRVKLLTTGEFNGDNQGFRSGSAVQSAYVRLVPGVRLIARAGYERIFQPRITDISAPILSAGFEFRPNDASVISLEGGTRYKRSAWAANVDVRLTGKLLLTGHYAESITPDQLYVANLYSGFVSEQAALPAPRGASGSSSFQVRENLYNQTSFNRRAELRLSHGDAIQSVQLSAQWSEREFLATAERDRSATGDLGYTRRLRPDLAVQATASYTRTFASPVYGPSETYFLRGQTSYQLNSTTDLAAEYAYRRSSQLFRGGQSLTENVVQITLQKRF